MAKPPLSRNRIIAAYVVAALADLIQIPITIAEATVFGLPVGVAIDCLMDVLVFAIITPLIGFNWLLLPTFLIEAIPGLDLVPTWVGCVALVVRQRKKEEQTRPIRNVTPTQSLPPPLL